MPLMSSPHNELIRSCHFLLTYQVFLTCLQIIIYISDSSAVIVRKWKIQLFIIFYGWLGLEFRLNWDPLEQQDCTDRILHVSIYVNFWTSLESILVIINIVIKTTFLFKIWIRIGSVEKFSIQKFEFALDMIWKWPKALFTTICNEEMITKFLNIMNNVGNEY